ncbi:EF-P 5-aminopentanol modification-associated protein YfmH [Alicyclobacillus macrosporangiidus]|uniref:EF-P 5-aminopentanol modification-associated protein YfmH n=1 Tax=Alicyclobacillus macrosporangiidus TaxID=392015 RepID=UPI0004964242|nr:pitrilysin family protein [Alicyclobacillus macrosporangiidus]
MRESSDDRLGHVLYHETLPNGLNVFLLPKPGFQQTFATFTTHYGSVDSTFRLAGEPEFTTVPDGIAHFLEHKMFESEHGDVFRDFARHGASANAYTTFDITSYLFSSTQDVQENLEVLLDFVQDPYFTDENVAKEKGIIAQEIRMYEDNPDTRVFYGLLRALYAVHPVRVDIAGTVESIQRIDKETLYRCYRTFYHPSNMVFFAVGGFDPEAAMAVIRENQARKSFPEAPRIERQYPSEPPGVHQDRVEARLAVSQPRCLIGWKDPDPLPPGPGILERELLTGVVLDVLFGRSSDLFDDLIGEGLIDQQFSWEYERTPEYGYSLIGGNTPDPDRLAARVEAKLDEVRESGLPEEEFERCRRKSIGRFMAALDSPSYIARHFASYHFRGADLFQTVEILDRLTLEDANRRMREHFVSGQQSISVVLPKA